MFGQPPLTIRFDQRQLPEHLPFRLEQRRMSERYFASGQAFEKPSKARRETRMAAPVGSLCSQSDQRTAQAALTVLWNNNFPAT
ncbi:hypothetical protein C0Z18_07860 [Trinickia dabaoshanensis]|uniref:Uncharacterized protein n=1 Tax=Trinickia dabaoshanensis TaxID=564714 RepID=A0A2N7VVC2_9BURK|nr:hypothetical protein C0Z18_07860 [Trinickia dabaoshanensis]